MLKKAMTLSVVLLLVLGAACAQDDDGGGGEEVEPLREIPMKLTIEMKGDRVVSIVERTVNTRIAILDDPTGQMKPTFGVQPVELVEEAGVKVQPGVTVIPYKGEGRYTIEPGAPGDLVKDTPSDKVEITSSVRIEYWPPGGEPFEYQRRAKACTVTVEDGGMKGRLQCPDLTHEAPGGPHFSLDFRWEKA